MRREPTIGGLKPEPEESITTPAHGAEHSAARPTAKKPARKAAPVSAAHHHVPSSSFSLLALLALFCALAAGGAAYWLYQELTKAQMDLEQANQRLIALEESLKLTDSSSTQTVAAINDSLKTHFSEIDKLWGTYRKHKAGIAANAKVAKSASVTANSLKAKVDPLKSELMMISDLVDAQQSVMTKIERENANLTKQAKVINDKNAKLEREIATLTQQARDTEQDIEAINGFRRSVNQQLLELKGGTQ
ncbi:hypothetical protein [Agaribacterium sp. ZY112]|uniref:hypothetical protein n=1 Tax=Agaribacterium sp. ZY112 TaxID=3233574 RepID=UPI0035242E9D